MKGLPNSVTSKVRSPLSSVAAIASARARKTRLVTITPGGALCLHGLDREAHRRRYGAGQCHVGASEVGVEHKAERQAGLNADRVASFVCCSSAVQRPLRAFGTSSGLKSIKFLQNKT